MTEYTESVSPPITSARKPRETESAWAWSQVAVAFLSGGLFQGLMVYCYTALMALVALDITATNKELMFPKMAMMAVGALVAPFIGVLTDRGSIKRVLAVGAVIFAAGLGVVSTADTILQLTLIFALFFGPLQAMLGPQATSALTSRWFVERRGLAIGVSNVGISVGAFLLPQLIKYLSADLSMGWREIFPMLAAGTLLFLVPIILALVIEKPDDYDRTRPANSATSKPLTTGMLFSDSGFWSLGVCVAIMYGLLVGVLSNLVQMSMSKGLSLPSAMDALSFLAIGGFIGKLAIGYLSDRINNSFLMAGILVVFSASLLPPVLFEGAAPIYASSFAMGFSAISSLPLWHSLTAQLFGVSNFARVIGLSAPIVLAGQVFFPWLTAAIADATGGYDAALTGYSATLIICLLLVIGIRAKEKQVLQAD